MRRINIAAPQFEYDKDDPDGFRSGLARLGVRNETELPVRVTPRRT
ncbi:MAG: hypothetical protein QOF06_321 [Solirubrobacterales bacterium]|jgi:hypothetical protein|nr:hypothetical protein [Solirubrobacterales bacterium]